VLEAFTVVNGQEVTNNGRLGSNLKAFLPEPDFGNCNEIFTRYYFMLGAGYNPLPADRKSVLSNGAADWINHSGKFGIGPAHETEFTVSGNSGGGNGNQFRLSWYGADVGLGGPNERGIAVGFHLYDYQDKGQQNPNPPGHRYGFEEPPVYERWGQQDGLGGVLYAGQWYEIETQVKLNTIDTTPGSATPYLADGILRAWVDGRLVFERTGMVFRTAPLAVYTYNPSKRRPIRKLGFTEIWDNTYHGGQTENTVRQVHYKTGLVWARQRIGSMKGITARPWVVPPPTSGVPAWVPAPGRVMVTQTNTTLISNNMDVAIPTYFEPFYARKAISASYSGAVANQYLGSHGALVFRGGGHAANNFNATFALVHNFNGAQWVNLSAPTAWFGNTAAVAILNSNDDPYAIPPKIATDAAHLDQSWADALPAIDAERRPAAPHSYSLEVIIPPSDGGGAFGSLFEVAAVAANKEGGYSLVGYGSHVLPINNAAAPAGNVWARAGTTTPATIVFSGCVQSAYWSAQKRTYYNGRSNQHIQMRWFDHVTGTHVQGTGASVIQNDALDSGNGRLLVIPDRNLLIGLCRVAGGVLRIRYADLSGSQPSAVTATLSQAVYLEIGALAPGWAHADYCPLTQKIYVFKTLTGSGGALDQTGVYTISLPQSPAPLTNQWFVAREAYLASTTTAFPANTAEDYQAPRWLPALKCFVWVTHPDSSTNVTKVYYYRPLGT
jgi:hypothetical protein